MTKLEEFEIIPSHQPDGGITATVPELPYAGNQGTYPRANYLYGREAIEGYLEMVADLGTRSTEE